MSDEISAIEAKRMSPNIKLAIITGPVFVVLFVVLFKVVNFSPTAQLADAGVVSSSAITSTVTADASRTVEVASSPVNASTLSNPDNPVLQISTSVGNLQIELYPKNAPVAVKKLIELINEGYYAKGTVLESRPSIGFVIAKTGADAQRFVVQQDEGRALQSQRGSVAILKSAVSSAYLNNIFVGYRQQAELQDKYIILGQVLKGLEEVEKKSRGKAGLVSHLKVSKN